MSVMPDYIADMMMNLKGKKYLPVAARILWFRGDHPDWGVEREIVELDHQAQFAIVTATIRDEIGRLISQATKREDRKGFEDYLEKAECVPTTTQILTLSGWKYAHELEVGEPVLSYDVESDKSEWVPLQRICSYKKQPVVRLHNGWGFDVVCTPKHTWAVSYSARQKGKTYSYKKLVETENLNTGHSIVTACVAPSGLSTVTPEQAAIMGWLITDGAIIRHGKSVFGMIYQSKPDNLERIRELLVGVKHAEYRPTEPGSRTFPSGKTYNTIPQVRWRISADGLRELLSSFGIDHESELDSVIPTLSVEARQAMLDSMMTADGDKRGGFGKKRRPSTMVTFSLLCSLQGKALGGIKIVQSDFPLYRMKKTRHTYFSEIEKEDAGVADVWCPTTKHGTWYARFQNGQCTVTGNTGAFGRALAYLGYGTLSPQDELPVDLQPPARMVDSPMQVPEQAPTKANYRDKTKPPSPVPPVQTSENKPAGKSQFSRVTDFLRGGEEDKVAAKCPYPDVGNVLSQMIEMRISGIDCTLSDLAIMWYIVEMNNDVSNVVIPEERKKSWPGQKTCESAISSYLENLGLALDDAGFIATGTEKGESISMEGVILG